VQKGWLKHVTIYLNKPIDSLPVRPIGFLQAHSSIRKESPCQVAFAAKHWKRNVFRKTGIFYQNGYLPTIKYQYVIISNE
jgi:hypothetical protein